MALKNKTISAGVLDILNIDGGIDSSTAKQVKDGNAGGTPLYLTTTKVGIGETSPDTNLHITGASTPEILLEENSTRFLRLCARADDMEIGWDDGDELVFGTFATTTDATIDVLMKISNDGNVGIGTSSPGENLHVYSTAGAAVTAKISTNQDQEASLKLQNSVDEWEIKVDNSTGTFNVADVGGAVRTTWLSSGNVGIGTASPNYKLEIQDTNANSGGAISLCNSDATIDSANVLGQVQFRGLDGVTTGATGAKILAVAQDEWGVTSSTNDAPTSLRFFTQSDGTGVDVLTTVAMIIDEDQEVGIGTTTPLARLHTTVSASGGNSARIINSGDTVDSHGIWIEAGHTTHSTVGTTNFIDFRGGNGATTGVIKTVDGVLQFVDGSDIRLKDSVVDTSINGLTIVNAMKVRDFNWKDSSTKVTAGFIANELKDVFAPAVDGEADAMENIPAEYDGAGNITRAAQTVIKPMTVSRERLVPVLVKAIQELSAKVTALENA